MKQRFLVAMVVFFILLAISVGAQDVPTNSEGYLAYLDESVIIEMQSGASFQGRLNDVMDDRIELLTPDGEYVVLDISMIESIANVTSQNEDRQGTEFYQDSVSNRLLFLPTAFPMEQGDFHVAVQEFIVITSSYGLTDRVSLWGGISPIAGMFSTRYSAPIGEELAVSAGGLLVYNWVGGFDETYNPILMPYAITSWGDEKNSGTFGGGVMMGFSSWYPTPNGMTLTFGGKKVLTSTLAFISENWFYLGEGESSTWDTGAFVPGFAFRIAGNRFSWDIGTVLMVTIDQWVPDLLEFPIPWLSLSYRVK